MIPPETSQWVTRGASIIVGSCDGQGVPEATRAVGWVVDDGGARVSVFVPDGPGDLGLRNLRANRRIAICCSYPPDHRTIQVKGEVLSIRPARADEEPFVRQYVESLSESLGIVGLPSSIALRIRALPCSVVEVKVHDVFEQTPGPRAGERIGSPT